MKIAPTPLRPLGVSHSPRFAGQLTLPEDSPSGSFSPKALRHAFSWAEATDTGFWLKKHPKELNAVASAIPDLTPKQKIQIARGVGHFKTRNAQKALFEPLVVDTNPKVLQTTLVKMRALARSPETGQKAWFQPDCNLQKPAVSLTQWLGQKLLRKAPPKPLSYIQAHAPLTLFYTLHKGADLDAMHLLETAAKNPLLHQGDYVNALRAELVPQVLKLQTTRLTVTPRVDGNLYVPQKEIADLLTRQVDLVTQLPFEGEPSRLEKKLGKLSYADSLAQLTQRVAQSPLEDEPKAQLLKKLEQATPATA